MVQKERKLAARIASYLSTDRPDLIYRFDIAADLRLPMQKAANLKRTFQHERGYPDLVILEPNSQYHGLFIELKADKETLYTLKGELRSSQHILEQVLFMNRLHAKGYQTLFVCSFEEFLEVLHEYEN